jgi:adenylate cyclase
MAKILVVDDTPLNVKMLVDILTYKGFAVATASGGQEALTKVESEQPDLVLLDVMMPDLSGYDVCRAIRANPITALLPVVMVTALDATRERAKGLDAGADDFLTKPINQPELMARVNSLLRIKTYQDQLADLNRNLESRVQEQLAQIERLGQISQFFPKKLAEAIVSGNASEVLKPHRCDITAMFLDLRGFTSFAETSEPEELMSVLAQYHAEVGKGLITYEGTLEHFAGDGIFIFFNDPVKQDNPTERAIRMALELRERVMSLMQEWRKRGFELGFGVGISHGYATIGAAGHEGRWGYCANGSVCNLAARLCSHAQSGQILISQRVVAMEEAKLKVEELGEVTFKGFTRATAIYNVISYGTLSL